jgi:hypothetical protein
MGSVLYVNREATLAVREDSDCTDTLLDVVCYEAVIKRLSPEMEDIFEQHLQCCPSCRQKFLHLRLDLQMRSDCRNFG